MSDSRLARRFLRSGTSSFADFLTKQAPTAADAPRTARGSAADLAPHGTTIVAATFPGGVIMAGDRRATMGNIIAQRDIEKVFPADEFSCVASPARRGRGRDGATVPTELEHYEKIEGTTLSMDGKANRLAALIRSNLAWRCRGWPSYPSSPASTSHRQGRIFSYDVTGGRYEETAFDSVGSGSLFARGSLKKLSATTSTGRLRDRGLQACTTPPTTTRPPGALI